MPTEPMLELPLEGGPIEVVGALELRRHGPGLVPRRLPAWTSPQIPDLFLEAMVQMPAGVRLRLRTDATAMELDVLVTHFHPATKAARPAVFDLVVGREVRARATTTVGNEIVTEDPGPTGVRFVRGQPTTVRFDDLPGTPEVVEIWLPHRATVELRALRVPTGALAERAPAAAAPRWAHYGSSISHCQEVDAPTDTWPALAAFEAGVELQNLAFGGNCMLDPFVARTLRDLPVDAISLKLGINVVNGDTLRERTFSPAVHGFLDTIREGHPTTPILVVSPIWCPSVETHPGPNVVNREERFVAVKGLDEIRLTCLTLEKIRATLATVVATRRELGDQNLHLLDGLRLFGPEDAADLPDDLHPNAAGYARMAHRFAAAAFGPTGPLSSVARPPSTGRAAAAS